jgi:hypothetical protein
VIAPSNFINVGATLRWRVLLGENLLQVSAAAAARLRPGGGSTVNEHYAFEVINWSPPFEGGRFVTRVLTELRQNDLDNNQVVLGAGLGLRGTPSGAYVGRNMVLGNFEYRTRPFNITTLLAGLVLFYDVGSAWTDGGPELTHTVGIGLRILIPQLNTQVIRLDLGFVLNGDADLTIDRFSSTFGQVSQVRPGIFDDPF